MKKRENVEKPSDFQRNPSSRADARKSRRGQAVGRSTVLAAGLSFAGFLHPLGQNVLRMSGNPTVPRLHPSWR
ncbi:MAG TPA: hypothetical protein VMR25_15175 [Planctomycetaceae bacterium]|jgi:hypothetical protein|nr:hypothetical protein [Planctomycetaceae bacterium]